MKLRKSPFKTDRLEKDPNGYALRIMEINNCAMALFNNKNILITGPRGIGKSSLAYQLQNLYSPDSTLLKRCKIDGTLEKYIKVFYVCDRNSTLADICLDLLHRIERECLLLKTYDVGAKKNVSFELNLGVFKAAIENEIVAKSPGSIITQLVQGLNEVYRVLNIMNFKGINILIDEIDLVSKDINVARFLELVHEYCIRDGLENITFILAGQLGTYSRLLTEDKSSERLLMHIPISKLVYEASEHILDYSSAHAKPPFRIGSEARKSILKIAGGYPYIIHLLADAAFMFMDNVSNMKMTDVTDGLAHVLRSDKQDKYISHLSVLNSAQRITLVTMASYISTELPARIPITWLLDELKGLRLEIQDVDFENPTVVKSIINQIREKGFLILNKSDGVCQFNDELFRFFLLLRNKYTDFEEIADDEKPQMVPYDEQEITDIVDYIHKTELNPFWDFDQYHDLMNSTTT